MKKLLVEPTYTVRKPAIHDFDAGAVGAIGGRDARAGVPEEPLRKNS